MSDQTNVTPGRKFITGCKAAALEYSIIDNANKKVFCQSIKWGALNVSLLSIILYDLIYTCSLTTTTIQYIEYFGAVILALNTIYHLWTCLKIYYYYRGGNSDNYAMGKPLFTNTPAKNSIQKDVNTPTTPFQATPMNMSTASWMSNSPANDSQNFPIKSNSWIYCKNSPNSPHSKSMINIRKQDTSGVDFIDDEDSLNVYLKDFEENEKINNVGQNEDVSTNMLSSFWTHPITKTSKDVSAFLKKCHYQLSTPAHAITSNSPNKDDKGSPHGTSSLGVDTWRRLNIEPIVLTQWNANLRVWLSQTILTRLITEFDSVDESLQKHGFNDVQIGKVGLDRLRKTAQTAPVLQFIQTLPTLIPFLELTPNQEYLVKRIKELAKGGCMSDFKWNSGSGFNGKDWDNSLPTDSAIIMHLFASYLDTQLQPLPNQPDVKPFSGYHYIKTGEKPNLTPNTLAIQQVVEYPPHHRVVIGEEIFEVVKGYNNLFHSILLFLYYVNRREHGMLGQVNLGRSGVNLLWVIQSQ